MHPFRFLCPFTVTRPLVQHFNISCRCLILENSSECQKNTDKCCVHNLYFRISHKPWCTQHDSRGYNMLTIFFPSCTKCFLITNIELTFFFYISADAKTLKYACLLASDALCWELLQTTPTAWINWSGGVSGTHVFIWCFRGKEPEKAKESKNDVDLKATS